jgi:hypothetical protein
MTLRASCAGITLLALLGSDVVASAMDDNKREPNIKTAEAIELFVSCESSYPLLSVKWVRCLAEESNIFGLMIYSAGMILMVGALILANYADDRRDNQEQSASQ